MTILPPTKIVQVQLCVDLECLDPADIIVAPRIAYCGTHALEWYMAERVAS